DFVTTFGWADGESVTVNVLRDGVQIGTATGAAADPEASGSSGLEVNHGPEGAPLPGDCWVGNTPDIQPGDVIQATNGTTVNEITVDDIRFTSQPRLARNRDVLVDGVARTFNGRPIAPARLDSAEFRDGSAFRVFANEIRVTRRAGVVGGFRLRINPNRQFERNRENRSPAAIRRTLLNVDGWAIGFGHIEPPPADAQLAEGLGDTPGPAPGCEDAPSASWGVNNVAPNDLNRRNLDRGLTVNGIATGATAVSLRLRDGTGPVVTRNATLNGNRWTASFTRAQLRSLNGMVRVAGRYTIDGGTISGNTMTLRKDLVRPNEPRASLRAGTYRRTKRVALRGGRQVAQIRYTLGGGRQARPTAGRGTVYNGRIRISSTQVLKAVAIDQAGNVSTVKR
ncbi:MAG: chitobiase/beta-hexosaminidase C-terminal domain-containing protein, partial [Stackebrandtia sp.]